MSLHQANLPSIYFTDSFQLNEMSPPSLLDTLSTLGSQLSLSSYRYHEYDGILTLSLEFAIPIYL